MIEFEFKENSANYICRENSVDIGILECIGGFHYLYCPDEDLLLDAQDLRTIADKLDQLNGVDHE